MKANGKKKDRFISSVRGAAAAVLVIGLLFCMAADVRAAVTCKSLCGEALKATGGSSQLKYQSSEPADFGGFSVSDRKKTASIMYVCDDREIYSICVARATSKKNASSLLKSLKDYRSANCDSDYLTDYSSAEQKVFKSAVCGKKGKYVWYIAMSPKKSVNQKGQSAVKKKA